MAAARAVIAPNLTPYNEDYSPDIPLFVEHAKRLLAEGCTSLAPFGTTGEANSLGMKERMALLEAMVASGIPATRIIPGTGLTSLPDTITLSRHATELGAAGVMVLPPFYYKDVSDDGLHDYFARLIDGIGLAGLRIYLYHIPQVTKVGLSIALVRRLAGNFPGVVTAIKDSSGDWHNTAALLREIPAFTIFPGNELQLVRALTAGAAGCITATANINAAAIARIASDHTAPEAAVKEAAVDRFRMTIQPHGPIPALKALLARRDNHAGWARVRPPLLSMSPPSAAALADQLAAIQQD